MTKMDYLKLLVDEIHSTTVATIGSDGHPQTRIIDMMYYDEEGVYFLTAKGKAFYDQLMEQQYVACLLYTSPSPRDKRQSRMPSSA